MAAYNASATIGETIDSVLAQTRPPDEIVVVDDGSTDGTGDHPVLRHETIRVVRQDNGGMFAALNTALDRCGGDRIAFLDADDLWTPDKLERQSAFLDANVQVAAVFGQVVQFACPTSTAEDLARWQIVTEPQPGWLLGTMLIRREAVLAIGRFDETLRVGGSIDWMARLRDSGAGLAMQDEVALRRRIHAGSLSQRTAERDRAYLATVRKALLRRRGKSGS